MSPDVEQRLDRRVATDPHPTPRSVATEPPHRSSSRPALPESVSVLLDVIRFGAALLVVACHATQPEFHLGYRTNDIIGVVAVSIFFVLSGFVIRFVSRTREATARDYFIDRASRIYSVVLPALVLTLLVGALCALFDRPVFLREWASLFDHPIARLALNLVFLSQAWGHNTIPFMNLPFWSLGYECVFYVLYGAIFYLRGTARALLCLVVALLVGPQVLFLLPIWYLGCWLFDVFQRIRRTRAASILLAVSASWLLVSLLLFVLGRPALLFAPVDALMFFANLTNPLALLHLRTGRSTLFAFGVGLASAAVLFLLLLLCDRIDLPSANAWSKPIRTVADGTFTIYLMHYPLIALLVFAGVLRPFHPVMNFVVFVLLCVLLVAAAIPVDAFKRVLRRWLRANLPWHVAKTMRP